MKRISLSKVMRDLMQEKARTFTVLAAIILGVFAVAMLSTSRNLLDKNLTDNYLRTKPASFTLYMDSLSSETRKELESMEDIEDVEIRDMVVCRFVLGNSKFIPIQLFIVEDLNNLKLNTFRVDKGIMPEEDNSLAVERSIAKVREFQVGEKCSIYIPGIGEKEMHVTGIVHDAGQAPSWMEGTIYGYVKRGFFDSKYLSGLQHQVKFTVAADKYNEGHIKDVVLKTKNYLTAKGYNIIRSEVPAPGVHIHEKQMNSLMYLIMLFSALTLILSCFLIINMISAIMAKEVRQIGVMKALGASSGMITFIYMAIVFILGLAAIVIATPVGIAAGKAFAEFNARTLNFELFYKDVDLTVIGAIIIIGIMLPVLIAIIPVWRASRVSVNSSLNNFGVGAEPVSNSKLQGIIKMFPFSKSFVFAVKNSFRRKGRLILTLITLILAGSLFITTFNIRESANYTIAKNFDEQPQDLMYELSKPQPVAEMLTVLYDIEGIKEVEYGNTGIVTIQDENGLDGKPLDLKAVDPSSMLYIPEMTEGKWLSDLPDGIVVNHVATIQFPFLKLGSEVNIKINGKISRQKIVGVCSQLFIAPRVYITNSKYSGITGIPSSSKLFLVDVADNNAASIGKVNKKIEEALAENNIEVKMLISKEEYKHLVVEHLAIIIAMLITMTILVIIVGGLGIITTMGINIMERNREIGILRAIGITNSSLYKIIMYEGGVFGLLSWIFSIFLSIPASMYLGNGFFNIFFQSNMTFKISSIGIVIWLVINVVFCIIASLLPARKAASLSVNQALAYE